MYLRRNKKKIKTNSNANERITEAHYEMAMSYGPHNSSFKSISKNRCYDVADWNQNANDASRMHLNSNAISCALLTE